MMVLFPDVEMFWFFCIMTKIILLRMGLELDVADAKNHSDCVLSSPNILLKLSIVNNRDSWVLKIFCTRSILEIPTVSTISRFSYCRFLESFLTWTIFIKNACTATFEFTCPIFYVQTSNPNVWRSRDCSYRSNSLHTGQRSKFVRISKHE